MWWQGHSAVSVTHGGKNTFLTFPKTKAAHGVVFHKTTNAFFNELVRVARKRLESDYSGRE